MFNRIKKLVTAVVHFVVTIFIYRPEDGPMRFATPSYQSQEQW